MRVVVFGATGVQGKAQLIALIKAGHTPVAVSRSASTFTVTVDGKPVEVETAVSTFDDKEALAKALKGADGIFLNLPSTSFQPAEYVISAARNIGLAAKQCSKPPLIIFNTSMPVPEETKHIEAQDHRREMRELLRNELGLPVISMQPVVFIDNLLEGWAWPPIRDTNTIVYCHYPELNVSWICHDDIASCMIGALKHPELAGRNIPIGGPETVRLPQLAEKLSRAWNREMKYEFQTVRDFCDKIGAAMKDRSGIDAEVLKEQMFRAYTWYNEAPEEPFKVDMGPVLKELGMKPDALTPIEDWGRRHNPFA